MKLYNVTRRCVGLMWGENEEDAFNQFGRVLDDHGFEVMPDGNGETVTVSAFESEPVEDMGWDGEDASR